MLGKTNITSIKDGTVITDVEDFVWNEVGTRSVDGAFKKSIFGNNTLVAVTEGGTVIYSKDGENWDEALFEANAEYKIIDVVWDGKRFVFAANDPVIITTEDFQEYKRYAISDVKRLYAIFYNADSTYTVIAAKMSVYSNNYTFSTVFCKGTLEDMKTVTIIDSVTHHTEEDCLMAIKNLYIKTAHSSNIIICYIKEKASASDTYSHQVGISEDGTSVKKLLASYGTSAGGNLPAGVYYGASNKYKVFSFKNAVYYMDTLEENKELIRLKDLSDEKGDVVSAGKDWGFIGGVYFNKCDVLVNANQMLVVKSGEHLADKVIEDLIDITYDFAITNIIKAFEKIYLFGTGGHILVSSNEIKNENALAIKTMSASKALYEAQKYADEKCKELEERVARLEDVNNSSSTAV